MCNYRKGNFCMMIFDNLRYNMLIAKMNWICKIHCRSRTQILLYHALDDNFV